MTSLRQALLERLWYVHPVTVITVHSTPIDCMQALQSAARPSLQKLHLRNLFTDGRRYFIDARKEGFLMTSNSKIPWRRRARTSVAAIVQGTISPLGEEMSRIQIQARMRLFFFLDIFLIPFFITSILVFAPWPRLLIAIFVILLFGLSWAWHRLTATLQAADIIYFVEKALEDQSPGVMPMLAQGTPQVITQDGEFQEQWQKFYEQHKNDPTGSVG